jgi:hypothetical protein
MLLLFDTAAVAAEEAATVRLPKRKRWKKRKRKKKWIWAAA